MGSVEGAMSKQKITSPFYGLFRGYLRFKIRDIKYIPSRLYYFFKHGFSQTARWSFDSYFIEMMKQILVEFRDNSWGYPIFNVDRTDEENQREWRRILNRMLTLLNFMDKDDKIYDNISFEEQSSMMDNAKEEFFDLFCKNFYHFWD